MTVTFLVRILLVALGVFAVVRAGESVLAFVAAFFASYFVFVAVEGAFVHTLSRGNGTDRMTAASLVTLALSLSLAQATGHARRPTRQPRPASRRRRGPAPTTRLARRPPHGGPPSTARTHEDPAQHGAAAHEDAGHDESLGAVMMHHVADGYVLELPGFCGGFPWACHVDLRDAFGTGEDRRAGGVEGTWPDRSCSAARHDPHEARRDDVDRLGAPAPRRLRRAPQEEPSCRAASTTSSRCSCSSCATRSR